jgi:hypothetical protein
MDFPPYGPADLAAKMDAVEDRLTAIFERLFDLYEVRLALPTLPTCPLSHAPLPAPSQSTAA